MTYNFLDSKMFLCNSQYGFQQKHSCEHAVGELGSNITKNDEKSKHTVAIFLDLSKPITMISHNMWLWKLKLYGSKGEVNNWFKHYLSNRKRRVKCVAGDPH